MSVPNEYSIECEDCKSYNISPVRCESCWKKRFKKKQCRHDWRIGAGIGGFKRYKNGKIKMKSFGLHIWCWKCGRKIHAYYGSEKE